MIEGYRLLGRKSNVSFGRNAYSHNFRSFRGTAQADSACALELTRRVAGNVGAVHAGFAYVNALTELPCIKLCVSLGNAGTLLIRVPGLLRTRRKAES
jgi:hypothetical protein